MLKSCAKALETQYTYGFESFYTVNKNQQSSWHHFGRYGGSILFSWSRFRETWPKFENEQAYITFVSCFGQRSIMFCLMRNIQSFVLFFWSTLHHLCLLFSAWAGCKMDNQDGAPQL